MSFIFLFVLILQHSLSCIGPIYFPYNLPFKYSECVCVSQSLSRFLTHRSECVSIFALLFCKWLTYPVWWWRHTHPLKCWQTTTRLYRIMTQKTAIFIVTAITPSFTNSLLFMWCNFHCTTSKAYPWWKKAAYSGFCQYNENFESNLHYYNIKGHVVNVCWQLHNEYHHWNQTSEFNIHGLNVISILMYLGSDYCVGNSDLYSEMYNITGIKDSQKSIALLTIFIKIYCLDKK
jgi:hypothetical protein